MAWWIILLVFICICMDGMVIANMSGMKPQNDDKRSRLALKLALMFTLIHVIMLLLGYVLAWLFAPEAYLARLWIAFSIIMLMGIRLLLESIEKSPSIAVTDEDMNKKLLKISFVLGGNTAFLGFVLYCMNRALFLPVIMLIFVSMAMTMLGFFWGKPSSKEIASKKLEAAAGIICILTAVGLLVHHLY